MSLHRGFVALGYVITVIDSVPYWLPAFAIVAAVIAWVTRPGRDPFQETAADAAREPLPKRTVPMRDDRPGTDDQALATCIAIHKTRRPRYAKTTKGGRR